MPNHSMDPDTYALLVSQGLVLDQHTSALAGLATMLDQLLKVATEVPDDNPIIESLERIEKAIERQSDMIAALLEPEADAKSKQKTSGS